MEHRQHVQKVAQQCPSIESSFILNLTMAVASYQVKMELGREPGSCCLQSVGIASFMIIACHMLNLITTSSRFWKNTTGSTLQLLWSQHQQADEDMEWQHIQRLHPNQCPQVLLACVSLCWSHRINHPMHRGLLLVCTFRFHQSGPAS